MDNFDLKKYLAEGRLLKEELTPLQQYVYDYEKEVSGEDNAKEFLDGIKKLNTPNDVYDYYAFERNWEGDSDLEGDLENIYNQVLDKFKSKKEKIMDNFDLKKYLAEGKLYENEEQGYTLFTTNVEYDNGKTGYMYQLVNSEDREENEIGFDQLFFDDEDNRLEMGVDFNSFDQGSYQEGEYTADEAMELYRKINENLQDHSDEEELELDADYDKGGKYYSEEGAEAFRVQPFKLNNIEYTKHEANRMGRYIVGLEGEELKKFISDYMAAWKEDVGDTPEGKTFK